MITPKNSSRNCAAFVVLALLMLNGCLGQEHLASMDKNTERLADEVEKDGTEIKNLNGSTKNMSDEMTAYRNEFKSLNQSTKSMAEEVKAYRKYADTLTDQMTRMTSAIESLAEMKADIKGLNQNTKHLADEIGSYRKYLDILTDRMTTMVQTLESLSKFGTDTVKTLMTKMFRTDEKSKVESQKAVEKTDDIDDVLNGAGAPSTEPSPNAPAEEGKK